MKDLKEMMRSEGDERFTQRLLDDDHVRDYVTRAELKNSIIWMWVTFGLLMWFCK